MELAIDALDNDRSIPTPFVDALVDYFGNDKSQYLYLKQFHHDKHCLETYVQPEAPSWDQTGYSIASKKEVEVSKVYVYLIYAGHLEETHYVGFYEFIPDQDDYNDYVDQINSFTRQIKVVPLMQPEE